MRGVHPFQRLSLGKRLTLLVMIAMALSCIVLAAAMTVAGDQMLYTIYASQTTVTRGDDRYGLPTVSKGAAASGTVLLPTGEKGPLYAEDRGLGAKFKYRIESIVYVICTIAVAGVATYMITENCLSPLVNLKNQVANLSAQNLSDSPEGGAPQTGDEIESLFNAFQGMRLRLDSAFETQKRFAANAAHELRTPLAAIQTRLDVFSKHEDHTEEEYQALIGSLRRQTERLSLLVKDLLDMSCMEEVPMQDAIDVAPLMDEIAHELEPLAEKKGMSFRTEGGGTVLGSDRLIARALYNLAENAVKYGADGGHVVLAASFQERNVLIRVEDDGPGIPEEHREKIFEPFYRVDKSRSRAMGGAGLGLPMTRAILERHGGTIWLEERPGGGCCFCAAPPHGEVGRVPWKRGGAENKGSCLTFSHGRGIIKGKIFKIQVKIGEGGENRASIPFPRVDRPGSRRAADLYLQFFPLSSRAAAQRHSAFEPGAPYRFSHPLRTGVPTLLQDL